MDLETIIEDLGPFGKYQALIFVIMNLCEAPAAWTIMLMAVSAVPDWWCVPENNNNTVGFNNSFGEFWQGSNSSYEKACLDPVSGSSCSSIKFDDSISTVATEFSLVCDRSWIKTTITTIQMAGVLLGSCVAGQLGDLIGRKKTFFLVYALLVIVDILAMFSPSWQVFAVVRFVLGFCCGGVLLLDFTLPIEFVGKEWRTVTGAIPFWSLGVMTLGLLAWLIPHWKYLTLSFGLLGAPILLSWWFIPESVRWLVAHGRIQEAQKTLEKIAKFNGKPVPDQSELEVIVLNKVELAKKRAAKYTYLDLFSTKEYTLKTLKLTIIWFSCGLTFYGLSFGAGKLAGNIYLNIFLTGLVEAPAVASVIYFNNCAGRRATSFAFLIISAVASLSVIVVVFTVADNGGIISALALTAKLGIAGGWVAIQVFTAEHYPTVVRSLGYGFVSMAARIGSNVAPQVVYLDVYLACLPYIIYGVLMATSAILALNLAETRGMDLPDEFAVNKAKRSNMEMTEDTKMMTCQNRYVDNYR